LCSAEVVAIERWLPPTEYLPGDQQPDDVWRVYELLRACSKHPQLVHVSKDEVVLEQLLEALAADSVGITAARFCCHIGSVLAAEEPSSLASFLSASANVDYLATLCAKHLASCGEAPEVGMLVDACLGDRLNRTPAIRQFLKKLQDMLMRNRQSSIPDRHLRFLCELTASRVLPSMPMVGEAITVGLGVPATIEPSTLMAAARLCSLRMLPNVGGTRLPVDSVILHAEKLIESRDTSSRETVSCLDSVFELLIERCEGKHLGGESLMLPATLRRCSELCVESVKYSGGDGRSVKSNEHSKLACNAARLLLVSLSPRVVQHSLAPGGVLTPIWSISDVKQCSAFRMKAWTDCMHRLDRQRVHNPRGPSTHARTLLQIAILIGELPELLQRSQAVPLPAVRAGGSMGVAPEPQPPQPQPQQSAHQERPQPSSMPLGLPSSEFPTLQDAGRQRSASNGGSQSAHSEEKSGWDAVKETGANMWRAVSSLWS